MKSVNLDRKISSSTARIPKRSTVVQSPSGRVAQPNDSSIPLFSGKPPVPSRKDQPVIDPVKGTTIARPQMPHPVASQKTVPTTTETSNHLSAPPPTARPQLQRAITAVEIVNESGPDHAASASDPGLGGPSEPTQDEKGITLADLPVALEAEQAREQQRYLPAARSGVLLSELSALEYLIVRHTAALILSNETGIFREGASLDDLLEIIDARKGTFWNKLFKGNKKEKVDKKKGALIKPGGPLFRRTHL